jgi:hypothetical protein
MRRGLVVRSNAQSSTVLHSQAQYCTVKHSPAQHCTVLHSQAQSCAALHSNAQSTKGIFRVEYVLCKTVDRIVYKGVEMKAKDFSSS